MTEKFRATEATEWNSHGHLGRGKVRKKLTLRTLLKGNAYLGDNAGDEAPPRASDGSGVDDSSTKARNGRSDDKP
jgi:hypothetical protein